MNRPHSGVVAVVVGATALSSFVGCDGVELEVTSAGNEDAPYKYAEDLLSTKTLKS